MAGAKPTLVYVADPMCSWCWGFAPVIHELSEAFSDALSLQVVAGGLRPYTTEPLDETTRQEILHHWHSVHELTGQPFTFRDALPSGFLYDTEPACRAVVVARQLADDRTALRFLLRIHESFYVKLADPKDPNVLHGAARAVKGLDADALVERLESDAARNQTLDDFRLSYGLGVRGFPTVLLRRDRRYGLLSSGYQPGERLRPAIEAWLAEDSG